MDSILVVLLGSTLLLMTPIMLAALGEIIAERAGVLNISIEGVMLCGCFAAAAALQFGMGLVAAVLVSVPAGLLLGAALSWLYITRRVNQIVGGILFNLLALGLTTMLYVSHFTANTAGAIFQATPIPLLSELPIVGPSLFNQPLFVYLVMLLVPMTHHLLFSTWFGLHTRAAGERPEAVDSAGVSVNAIRGLALTIGCALIALGGAALVVLQSGAFTAGMTAGKGFIALAIAMVARWRPLMTIPAAALFGFAESFQYQAQTLGLEVVPSQLWSMLPYVVTILAVVIGRAARYPAAIGVSYRRAGVD
jgi:simple sugar transport system permease protein